jgi:peptidoglycan hydrolase-like protein with peptidoglycan-binding domain
MRKEDTMITMADSIIPENLPPSCGAYMAYVDGHWPTADRVREMFPDAHVLTLTVAGAMPSSLAADGCDCETGDLTPAQAAEWAAMKLATWPSSLPPVVYASASAMAGVLDELAGRKIPRARVRLLSAHYGEGNHVCGPDTCKATPVAMDGTQWSDTTPGVGGTLIDLSTLEDDFFGAPAPVTVEADVTLQQIQNGSTGQAVQNWQGLLVAHALGWMIATGKGDVMLYAGVDGAFGAKTEAATRKFQAGAGLPPTGIVDAATWQKALG